MPQAYRLKGYRELLRACSKASKDTNKKVRGSLRKVGDIVKVDAGGRIQGDLHSPRSAEGLRTRVRQRGVSVEQSLRKTTGTRPDWGATQMRDGLVPALLENEPRVRRELEHAIDEVADHFSTGRTF